MAQLLKDNGDEQGIRPANGVEFTPLELRQYVGGALAGISLTPRLHLYLAENDVSRPVNAAATILLAFHRPDLAHLVLSGDIVVADISETGDDEA